MKLIFRTIFAMLMLFVVAVPTNAMGQFMFPQVNSLIGKKAPNFELDTALGKHYTLDEFRGGKKAIIFFWATWCPHCRVALKELNSAKREFERKGIKIILVDLGEDGKVVKQYIEKFKINYDVFLDTNSQTAEQYDIVGVPTLFFMNEKGIISAVEHSLPDDYETSFEIKS